MNKLLYAIILSLWLISSVTYGQTISTIAGTGTYGYSGDGGAATAANLGYIYGLATDNSGTTYFSDTYNNVVRKIDASGTIRVFAGNGTSGYSGDGGAATLAQLSRPRSIVVDKYGNVIIYEDGNHRIRKINTLGVINTIVGSGVVGFSGDGGPATNAELGFLSEIALDKNGNLYLADRGSNNLRKVDTNGIITLFAGGPYVPYATDGGPATNAYFYPSGIGIDKYNNIYISDENSRTIRKVDTTGYISTIAGTGSYSYSGDGGLGIMASFVPELLKVDTSGNIFFYDQASHKVRMINTYGIITSLVGNGSSGYSTDGYTATASSLSSLDGFSIDKNNNIYFSESYSYRVKKAGHGIGYITGLTNICSGGTTTLSDISTGGTWVSGNTSVAAIGSVSGIATGISTGTSIITYHTSSGSATAIISVNPTPISGRLFGVKQLSPGDTTVLHSTISGGRWTSGNSSIVTIGSSSGIMRGIMIGAANIIYTVTNACTISGQTLAGVAISCNLTTTDAKINTIAGNGSASFSGDGGPASSATMNQPTVMASDESGNIYFFDSRNARIRKIDRTGLITTIAGTGTLGRGGDIGMATSIRIGQIGGLAISKSGNIYFTDYSNNIIRKIDSHGLLTTVAGFVYVSTYGSSFSDGDGGAATTARLYRLSGITLDDTGNIYFVDNDGWDLRKVNSSGIISHFATLGSGPNSGLCRGINGDFYVNVGGYNSGYDNGVLKIDSSGTVVNIFDPSYSYYYGTRYFTFYGDGGPATNAQINGSFAVATDKFGNLYLADQENFRIRKIDVLGNINTIAGNGIFGATGDGGGATASEIGYTYGLAVDPSGNVYISDINHSVIRRIGTASNGPITGNNKVCIGLTSHLNDTTSGGSWSSGNVSIATIGSTGIVTGISKGIATISYTTTCGYSTISFFVEGTPFAGIITGADSVSIGGGAILSDTSLGGTWQSSNAAIGSIDYFGVVTGVAAGSTVITYSVANVCGPTAMATKTIKVGNGPISAIGAHANICIGTDLLLTESTGGGYWSSNNPSVATIDTSGLVFGNAPGNATISYTLGGSWVTTNVVVDPMASSAALSGTAYQSSYISTGQTMPLYQPWSGGSWTSSNTAVATVNSSGTVFGVSAGNAIITCNVTNSCGSDYALIPFIVGCGGAGTPSIITSFAGYGDAGYHGEDGLATNSALGGPVDLELDKRGNLYFVDYNTYTPQIRKINSSGIISTLAGKAYHFYDNYDTVSTSDQMPATNANLYKMSTNGIGVDSIGNVYYSDDHFHVIRKIDPLGVLHTVVGNWDFRYEYTYEYVPADSLMFDIYSGTYYTYYYILVDSTIFDYHLIPKKGFSGDGGAATAARLNNPAGISVDANGNLFFCDRSNNRIRKVDNSGIISTIAGNGSIGFSGDGGSALSAQISSPSGICTDKLGNVYFIDYGNNRVRKITPSGTISTVAGGGLSGVDGDPATSVTLNNISEVKTDRWGNLYLTLPGNYVVKKIDTNGIISTIAGNGTQGAYRFSGGATVLPLFNPGGVAVDTSGNVYIADGHSSIYYSSYDTNYYFNFESSDYLIRKVSPFNPTAPITGPHAVCGGSNVILSDTIHGGSWSSSNVSVATIGTNGLVSGVSAGTVIISYTNPCGISAIHSFTVNSFPTVGAISGLANVCAGGNVTLTDTASGGIWTSSNTAIATVGSTGTIIGVSSGTTIISYTINNSCGTSAASKTITVNPLPDAGTISGGSSTCIGTSLSLTDASSGGMWSSSNTGVATIGSTGTVTGISAGTTTISYSVANSCLSVAATKIVTINPLPNPGTISGASSICTSLTTTLTNSIGGGAWSSSNTSIATIGTTGVVNAVAVGSVVISYTTSNACGNSYATKTLTISGPPVMGAIVGPTSLCIGVPVTMTDTPAGGFWVSTNTSVATVTGGGVVTAVAAGYATIIYQAFNSCGIGNAFNNIVVVTPTAISGATSVCVSSNTTLTNTTSGGVWSSSGTGIATVGSSTGIVHGVSAGVVMITYLLPCGPSTYAMTVNPLPDAGTIAGSDSVCQGSSITLTDGITGGTWNSSNPSVASVSSGLVSGVSSGMAIISYSVTNGCGTTIATKTVYVNALPNAGAITGGNSVCEEAMLTLTDAVPGGVWSSSNANATVSGGMVTGVTSGSAIISYTVTNSCGAANATKTINVNPLPVSGTITGASSVCAGFTTILSSSASGGIWSSFNTSIAAIGSTGNVLGITAGTTIISYSVTNSCGTAVSTKTMLVNPTSNAGTISGLSMVCVGANITLTDTTSGGVWSASNANATVSGGVVTGVSSGIDTIIYSVTTTCGVATATKTISINPLPTAGAISGASTVCTGVSTALTDTVPGGIWSSANTSVATVGSTGSVTGVAAGTTTISYIVTNSCGTDLATKVMVVNTTPDAGTILGLPSVCVGANITLTDAASGGIWSVSNANASIAGGVVTGVVAGIDTVIYSVTTACGIATATKTISINPLPTAGSISGPASVCATANITLANGTTGGVWASANPSKATIGSTSGVVTGVLAGTATISYVVANSCGTAYATYIITINPAPNAGTISGPSTVGLGATITLTDATSGGVWGVTTGNASVSGGLVTGLYLGHDTITYSVTNICGTAIATKNILVDSAVAGITGITTLCMGSTTTLVDTGSGVWTSGNPGIATVGSSSGVVNGISSGVANITYTSSGGFTTITVTVNPTPLPIGGTTTMCVGSSTTLIEFTTGSTWSSASTSIATVGTTGIVSGVSAGTTTISYTNSFGCYRTTVVSINPIPAPIGGPASVCVGQTVTLINSISGGTWASSAPSIASVGSTTGNVTGVAGGLSTNITYTLAFGCRTTKVLSVNSLSAISGPASVCQGHSITLTNSVSGGSWSSADATASVLGSTGVVTGVSGGTATISYILPSGCATSTIISISPIAPITGPSYVCVGQSITLVDASPGGVWSSSAPTISTVGSTGVVTGVASGLSAEITYTLGSGCSVVYTVNVNALAPITGPGAVCQGQSITLTDGVGGGSWSSIDATVAVGSGTGVVTGVAGGTAIVSYVLSSGCVAVSTITINAISPISGPSNVCVGQTMTLTDASPGGTWSSSAITIATVGSTTGVVTGMAGSLSANISYTLGSSGCSVVKAVTVNPLTPISGPTSVCQGQNITLANSIAGGIWSTASVCVTIGSTSGTVSGLSAGTALISYLNGSGCLATYVVTVNPTSPISGPTSVCNGQSITLVNSIAGGTWSSTSPTIATIGSTTGILNAVAGGNTVVINYTVGTGCTVSTVVTVNPLAAISGLVNVCPALTITLTNSIAGGIWGSSATSIATVGSATGVVLGITGGTVTISYVLPTGCIATKTIAVGSMTPIIGPGLVCVTQPITLSDVTPGGTWQSSAPTVASVNSSGIVTGVAPNLTANITYAISSTCRAIKTVSVLALTANSISGIIPICAGQSNPTATNPTSGGIWSTSNTSIVTIGAGGLLTGVSAGSALVSYSLSSGCVAISTVTVNALSPIVGPTSVCLGKQITLTNATSGGTWNSGGTSATIASITSGGVVTGIAANLNAILTYTMGSGCKSNFTVSVLANPSAPSAIVGASSVSVSGSTVTYTDATTGGTWSSSNTAKATVGSATGIVTGVSVGSATITYTVSNAAGCTNIATKIIAVGPTTPDVDQSLVIKNLQISVGNVVLIPNPNEGEFILRGSLKNAGDIDVIIEVIDVLGQVVYTCKAAIQDGKVNEKVKLSNTLANGMYLLNLYSSSEHYTFQFVVER